MVSVYSTDMPPKGAVAAVLTYTTLKLEFVTSDGVVVI